MKIDFTKETMSFLKKNINEDRKVASQKTKLAIRELERSLNLFERLEIIVLPTNVSDAVGISKLKGKIKNLMESEQACLPFNWQKAINFMKVQRLSTHDILISTWGTRDVVSDSSYRSTKCMN